MQIAFLAEVIGDRNRLPDHTPAVGLQDGQLAKRCVRLHAPPPPFCVAWVGSGVWQPGGLGNERQLRVSVCAYACACLLARACVRACVYLCVQRARA